MRKLPFNVDAYTARLIGRENLSKVDSAIIELVKNTYDADASVCLLYYENTTNTLYIADNGCGMTEEIIERHWMTIGYSSKVENYLSSKGRVQTGSKGIGRFALDRISSGECIMLTKNNINTLKWIVNWEDFGERKKITETYAQIEETNVNFDEFFLNSINQDVKKLIREKFKESGTVFKLTKLRDSWDNDFVNKIKSNLSTLIPPGLENTFKMYFFTEDNTADDAKIFSGSMETYDYKIDFLVNDFGEVKINIHRNEFDFKGKLDEIIRKGNFSKEDREYFQGKLIEYNEDLTDLIPGIDKDIALKIGPFRGSFYFYKITSPKNEQEKYYYKDIEGRKNFSEQFGGIKIYRDKFKVRPYGDAGTSNFDWLMLSQRKNKSPAAISHPKGLWKVRSEQIVGEVNISRLNISIPDQANREGIVETKEFYFFKEALISIIEHFEEDRQYVIRKLSDIYYNENKVEEYKKEIEEKIKIVEDINYAKEDIKSEVVSVSKVKAVIQDTNERIKNLEDEIALLRALATTGIVTNTYVHELKGLTNELFGYIVLAKETLEEDDISEEDIKCALEDISKAYSYNDKFNSWFKVTIDSVREDRRKMKIRNINEIISNLKLSWKKVLEEKEINIQFVEKDQIEAKCFAYEIESIIHNLIANSVSAFEGKNGIEGQKNIEILIDRHNNGFVIIYEDNGPGLINSYKKDPYKILKSLETSKRNKKGEKIGTGMGMWIIYNIMKEYHGKIDLDENIKLTEGFKISLYFNTRKI